MGNLIDKGKVADKISDLFLDNYPDPSKELETFYKKVLKIVVNEEGQPWISVKDRLPEPNTWVLVYSKQGSYMNLKVDYITRDGSWFNSLLVTHWMPLPEPPESEE